MAKALTARVKGRVLAGIRAGRYPVEAVLPSSARLAADVRCSAATVERALLQLAGAGIVKRVRNRGTVVLRQPPAGHVCVLLSADQHTNLLIQDELVTRLRQAGFHADLVACPESSAAALDHCEQLRTGPAPRELFIAVSPVLPDPTDQERFRRLAAGFARAAIFALAEPGEFGSLPVIVPDHRQAARLMMEHLVKLGHRRIGVCAGYPGETGTFAAMSAGYCEEFLAVAGARCVPVHLGTVSPLQLCRDQNVTAYWDLNDHSAVLFANAAHRAGWRIPGDISVVGRFDTPWSSLCLPALTTVRFDVAALVAAMIARLTVTASATDRPAVTRIPMELVVRDSTGRAPARARKHNVNRRTRPTT